MGRRKLEVKRMNTTVTIRCDLKDQAKELNFNLSKLLEKAIEEEIKNHEKVYKKK